MKGVKKMETIMKLQDLDEENEQVAGEIARIRLREQKRQEWLKEQINNGKYLNKLNQVYKDNISQIGTTSSQIGSRVTTQPAQDDLTEVSIIGKHGLAHEKISKERTQKNAALVSQQMKQQT